MEVRFLLNPTVAVALTVSYTISITSASVTADKKIADNDAMIKNIPTTATDLFTACFGIFLPKSSASSLLPMVANIDTSSTAIVTVFIPPAVPTGEPPISIKSTEMIAEVLVRSSCGIVAKPAVRVVTAWNRDAQIRCGTV